MKMLPVSVAASERFPVSGLSSPQAGGCAGQEPSGVSKGTGGAQIPLLCASRAAWWPWTVPRGDRDPCVPSTRCPWHQHLPRCGGPLNPGFLLSFPLWFLLSLAGDQGCPGMWLGKVSIPTACAAGSLLGTLLLFPFLFSHFSAAQSLCPKVAELGRVSRAGVAFGFGLSVLHSIRDFTKRRRPRKAPFHHRLFIHHALVMPLCYPEHSCWAQREDWSSSLGAGLEGGGRNAPRAAPS